MITIMIMIMIMVIITLLIIKEAAARSEASSRHETVEQFRFHGDGIHPRVPNSRDIVIGTVRSGGGSSRERRGGRGEKRSEIGTR